MCGRWTCTVCGESSDDHLGLVGCPCMGSQRYIVATMLGAGHKPGAAATAKGTMFFCHTCGKYGRSRLAGLAEQCLGHPKSSGRQALNRLAKEEHPVKGEGQVKVFRGWRADRVVGRALV